MNTKQQDVASCCWLASLAFAGNLVDVGRRQFVIAVLMIAASSGAEVISTWRGMPKRVGAQP